MPRLYLQRKRNMEFKTWILEQFDRLTNVEPLLYECTYPAALFEVTMWNGDAKDLPRRHGYYEIEKTRHIIVKP